MTDTDGMKRMLESQEELRRERDTALELLAVTLDLLRSTEQAIRLVTNPRMVMKP